MELVVGDSSWCASGSQFLRPPVHCCHVPVSDGCGVSDQDANEWKLSQILCECRVSAPLKVCKILYITRAYLEFIYRYDHAWTLKVDFCGGQEIGEMRSV